MSCGNIFNQGLQRGRSHIGELRSGFSVKSCPQGHAAPAKVESEVPGGPAGAAEGEGSIEKMANTIPPIVGVEPRQLLKAGWTVIGGNPAAKVAHFPKTFRTPAPKFPRHRIRTTWGFKDEVWSLLEDSVNIDELEGIYGEVPEGRIASITLLALPEGEEEAQADGDVEPYSVP